VLLGGLDDHTNAIARVALGNHVDVLEADAAATVERAREERPDLVILDWAGAGAGGIADLRNDALTRDAKVLLLVDHAQSASRDVAAAGADERLASPFSPLQLQVKLRRLLGAEVVGG
jgi:serine/threonine-protein kinase